MCRGAEPTCVTWIDDSGTPHRLKANAQGG
jgi:hypothetical protein